MDFESLEGKSPREFLAVILAGFGNNLSPLTSGHEKEPSPKALLPVGNRPMISYTLTWLEESGVSDVLIICPISHKRAISHYLNSSRASETHSSMHIEFQTHDQSPELSTGTCSLLKEFAHCIDGDFILLSCDFLPPSSLKLSKILNKFRVDSTTDGSILTSLWYEHKPPEKEKNVEDDAWPSAIEPAPVVLDEKTGTLLHVDVLNGIASNAEEVELRMALLWSYPRTKLLTNLMDSHVYVCKRVVLDFIMQKPHLDSFREEFIPWLCKVHFEKKKKEKYVPNVMLNPKMIDAVVLSHASMHVKTPPCMEFKFPIHTSPESITAKVETDGVILHKNNLRKAESHLEHSSDLTTIQNNTYGVKPSLRCGIVLHRLVDGYAARANNIWTYLELNRNFLKDSPRAAIDRILYIDPKASISADSIIGQSTKVGERSSIKRSVIGRHCVIGKSVKVIGCVILDNCIIEDGAKLEGSLLGAGTRVHTKGELVRCITQARFEAEENSVYKHEKLESLDWVTEPQLEISD